MGDIFSVNEVVEMGVAIEQNGMDFYNALERSSEEEALKDIVRFLAAEEEKHLAVFKNVLSEVKKYGTSEPYPDEYYAYL